MTMRNRVTPAGEIVAIELRGAWIGNRGIVHRGTEIVRFHATDLWITCELHYKDWRLPQWADGHLTVLFFHDEAVSFAAGHRPCALCRREAYNRYRAAWVKGLGGELPSAKEIDRRLHGERLFRGTHRRRYHELPWETLPAAVFVELAGGPALVLDHVVVPWSAGGYGTATPRPAGGTAVVITPPASVAAIRAGYQPQVDESATAQDAGAAR
jgi:hypothetical protein